MILVAGSINMDFAVRTARAPAGGETVLGEAYTVSCGGKGANQAFACGRLGAKTAMLGAVGCDPHGQAALENLRGAGVEVERVLRCPEQPTGAAFITVEAGGENRIVVAPGANAAVTPAYLAQHRALFAACDLLLLQLEIPLDAVLWAAREAKRLGKRVILDPAPAAPLPAELLQAVDILKPNEHELAALTGRNIGSSDEISAAAQALLAQGPQAVVVTLGGHGAQVFTKGGAASLGAVPVPQVVDTTAAGDSFTAALAVALAEGKPLEEAAAFGMQVAGVVVTRPGAQSSIPRREELGGCATGKADG